MNERLVLAAVLLCGFAAELACAAGEADLAKQLLSVSDGEKDATAVLQQAIDSSVGAIRLPHGTYRITKTLQIDLRKVGYTSFTSDGTAKLIMAAAGPALKFRGNHFKSADPENFQAEVWQRERLPSVSNLAIEGSHPEACGIEAVGTMQLTISHVHIQKMLHCVRLLENNRNVIIDHCHFYQNRGVGVLYDQVNLHQSNIVGCHISYCGGGGIVCRGGNVRNIHVSGCDLESNMAADGPPTANIMIDCRESEYGAAEVAITGCTIQHNDLGRDSCNIRIIGQSVSKDKTVNREGHVTITGNVLSDVQHNVWLEECRGVTLVGNTFWMGFQHNLLVDRSSHIIVGANNFDRNPRYDYGHSLEAKNALLFRDCADCTLNGLHIALVWKSEAGLTLERCDRMNLSGLTILDCDNVGLKLIDLKRSRVTNCLIRDDRPSSQSKSVIIEGGADNFFDSSIEAK